MMILNVNKVSKSFGFKPVLNEISFSINEGEKVAIVGENGAGKSSLLKIIKGIESCDSGTISFKKGTKSEYLEQGDNADIKQGTCGEILHSAFDDLKLIEKVLLEYEAEMSKNTDNLDAIIKKYCTLQDEFINKGGYEIENKINYVVNGLKIDKYLMNREFNSLSGGERTLINFARILLSKPDLLLLDEPTNHLDIERIEWLEQYIKEYKGTILIVSHDRYFLDRVVNKIIEIDKGKAKIYFGNYSQYLEQVEANEIKEFEQYKIEQRKFAEMEKAIKRLKEWGKMADNPTFFRRARAIQNYMDRLKENAIEKPENKRSLPILFKNSDRASQEVLMLKNFSLFVGEKQLLDNANCLVNNGENVAIIGKNGCGKSSLLKCVLGENYKTIGTIKLGNKQQIGYLSQIIEFYDNTKSLLWTFMNELGFDEQKAKNILYKFQFYKTDWDKKVANLSGGEKIRLKLAILLQNTINLLILDEPTNHIDIKTREVLEESLKNFKGSLIFVSHDRYFINKLATKIFAFENKKIITYIGNYDSYLSEKNKIKV